jgi:hypothetical protein
MRPSYETKRVFSFAGCFGASDDSGIRSHPYSIGKFLAYQSAIDPHDLNTCHVIIRESWHPSLEVAMKQAELDFSIVEEDWIAKTMGKD